jgi:hypothetical protein
VKHLLGFFKPSHPNRSLKKDKTKSYKLQNSTSYTLKHNFSFLIDNTRKDPYSTSFSLQNTLNYKSITQFSSPNKQHQTNNTLRKTLKYVSKPCSRLHGILYFQYSLLQCNDYFFHQIKSDKVIGKGILVFSGDH